MVEGGGMSRVLVFLNVFVVMRFQFLIVYERITTASAVEMLHNLIAVIKKDRKIRYEQILYNIFYKSIKK